MASKPRTWAEKRDWLERHVAPVRTQWLGPGRFRSVFHATGMHPVCVVGAGGRKTPLEAEAKTGPASICVLFNAVTRHGPRRHLMMSDGWEVRVDPGTLRIKPRFLG